MNKESTFSVRLTKADQALIDHALSILAMDYEVHGESGPMIVQISALSQKLGAAYSKFLDREHQKIVERKMRDKLRSFRRGKDNG